MSGRTDNLKPWSKGVSGNPGGRPKTKPLTEVLQLLLEQEAPNSHGRTWGAVIADALLRRARKGDVRAFAELANRIEGRPLQSVNLAVRGVPNLAERVEKARKRIAKN